MAVTSNILGRDLGSSAWLLFVSWPYKVRAKSNTDKPENQTSAATPGASLRRQRLPLEDRPHAGVGLCSFV
jgi:hypothetical protein